MYVVKNVDDKSKISPEVYKLTYKIYIYIYIYIYKVMD